MHTIRGLVGALNSSGAVAYKPPEAVIDFLVVGGGVVGLAVAQQLCKRYPSHSTYLVERRSRAGEETSSRNSEVIHSGLYYPPQSLKTRLCLRGRELIYDRCRAYNIPHKKTGKLVVAHANQLPYIENLHAKSRALQWPAHTESHRLQRPVLPTKLLSGDEARELEPNLSKDIAGALWCPETGIIDSHSLMESLEKDIQESENGALVYSTRVACVDPLVPLRRVKGMIPEEGWVVQTTTGNEQNSILAKTLINASGLASALILNSVLPKEQWVPLYYAKGSYASYSGPGISKISHLIYPCPSVSKDNAHAFQSLGTHLTLDLNGRVRFGPDLEWISPPLLLEGETIEDITDFWNDHLVPCESNLLEMHQAIRGYLPEVVLEGLSPDYVGIRPKLVPPGGGFQDFVVRTDFLDGRSGGKRPRPMVSLMGIESPGLTSSLAIAEYVVEDVLGKVLDMNGEEL